MRENKYEKSHIHILQSDSLIIPKRLPNQPLIITNYGSMFTICQHFYTLCREERRRIERMMSICLTMVPIGGLGEPEI